jgi:UTP-glucose-1-phosphate uridylyltransferase
MSKIQAIILAGGVGSRLRPYTAVIPKPLMPIGDYPIAEVIVGQLKRAGLTHIAVSTGHLALAVSYPWLLTNEKERNQNHSKTDHLLTNLRGARSRAQPLRCRTKRQSSGALPSVSDWNPLTAAHAADDSFCQSVKRPDGHSVSRLSL